MDIDNLERELLKQNMEDKMEEFPYLVLGMNHEGFVYKKKSQPFGKSSKGLFFKYKKRYFCLMAHGTILAYFKEKRVNIGYPDPHIEDGRLLICFRAHPFHLFL